MKCGVSRGHLGLGCRSSAPWLCPTESIHLRGFRAAGSTTGSVVSLSEPGGNILISEKRFHICLFQEHVVSLFLWTKRDKATIGSTHFHGRLQLVYKYKMPRARKCPKLTQHSAQYPGSDGKLASLMELRWIAIHFSIWKLSMCNSRDWKRGGLQHCSLLNFPVWGRKFRF